MSNQLSKTTLGLALVAATITGNFVATPTAFAKEHWMKEIGHRWDVQDNGWKGVWSRRTYPTATSNIYDATFTHPIHPTFTAEMIITLSVRNEIHIRRTDKTGTQVGKSCTYKGYLHGDGYTANGTSSCAWSAGPHPWRATIRK
ncbi:MAG: hypothetical protein ABJN65_15020 [Parasphingorhabdus sp.]